MSTPEQALEVAKDPESEAISPTEERVALIDAAELFGATKLAHEFTKRIGAQTMRMLQAVRERKVWREYGYKSFDDFLDHHPHSPMTKHQFYERQKLLGIEGAEAFNALNALRFPMSKRKLLAQGDVSLDGNEMQIGEQKFDITDQISIFDALSTLALDRAQHLRTIERGKKELDTKKRKIDELEERMSHAGGIALDGTAHVRALVGALGEMALLNQEIAKIEDEGERKAFGDQALERIAAMKLDLEETLGYTAPEEM